MEVELLLQGVMNVCDWRYSVPVSSSGIVGITSVLNIYQPPSHRENVSFS